MKRICSIVALALMCQAVLVVETHSQKKKDKPASTTQKPTLAPGPGDQKKALTVTLKCATPDAVIRYTLDGSAPGPDNGVRYTTPIAMDKTTTITAVAFSQVLPPSPIAVGTYLFDAKPGLATFHIGNSLTNTTGKFADFVKTAGILHKYQSFTAGGAWTNRLWDIELPKRKDSWDKMLADYKKIDHFTCQPRDFNIPEEADYDIRFFNVIRKHSPDMQPWFYTEWVEKNRGRPTDQGKVPSSQMKKLFPAKTWEESMAAMLLYTEELQLKVCETYKEGKRPRVLPSSLAMGWIKNMIDNGKLPGAAPDSFYPLLFSDAVHPNVTGGYLVDLTWYAAFYREWPEGKILPAGANVTPAQAKIMQRLAWDVIKNYPDCGLYEEGTTPAGTPTFHSGTNLQLTGYSTVTLSSATPGAWFRYTLDGTAPTRTRGYVYCGVISAPAGVTLKAVAYKSGLADSPVAEKGF